MDPVTIIGLLSSLTSLIQSSHSIIQVIKSFKDGDKELNELLSSISVFSEGLKGFDRVLRSRQTIHQISEEVIKSALEDSAETIENVEHRLQQISSSEVLAIRRMKWVRHKSDLKRLHEQLKDQSVMLQTFLMLSQAETFLAVTRQHPEFLMFCATTEDELSINLPAQYHTPTQAPQLQFWSSDHTMPRPSTSSSIATIESSTFDALSLVSSASSVKSSVSSHHHSSDDVTSSISKGASSLSEMLSGASVKSRSTPHDIGASHGLGLKTAIEGRPGDMLVVRRACKYDCFCKCHEQAGRESHKGFLKLPRAKPTCTEPTCRTATGAEEKYAAQSNFFRTVLSQVLSSKSIKICYNLNTYRMISEGSDVMRHIKHGNLEKLKFQITSGEATLWDTAPDGWSLLHTAVYNQQLPIVKYLVDLGVDTENADVGSRRPADLALFKSLSQDATQTAHDIVEVFSQKDNYIDDFDFTPIHIAVLELYDVKDTERPSLEELIDVVDAANNAPLGTDWMKWKVRYSTKSPLFGAIIEYFRASAYEQPKGTKIIQNLLDEKDKKNCWTPLHWAAAAGKVDKMRILVEHGADPFLLSNLNANILHAAAESKINHGLSEALEIWKRYPNQLNINQANRWTETPLHVASWTSPACIKLLLEAGASPDAQQEDGQVPLHCVGLTQRGPDRRESVSLLCDVESLTHINTQDVDGRPPIFEFLNDSAIIEMLINHGARLDLYDNLGRTIFHHACIQDESDALRKFLNMDVDPVIITMKDQDGVTPLIEALCHASIDCAMVLLELDDIGDIVGKNGWAAVHYAAKIGDADLLEAVLRHSSFIKGVKTDDGKTVDNVAMEAGTWCGKVKDLIRKYNSMS